MPLLTPTAAALRACCGCPRRPPWLHAAPPPAAAAPRAGRGCPPILLLRLPAPRPSAAAAKLKTLKPLQDAVEAPCPLAVDYGGCKSQSLAYATQFKHLQVRDLLWYLLCYCLLLLIGGCIAIAFDCLINNMGC